MLPLVPLALSIVPELIKMIAGDKAGAVASVFVVEVLDDFFAALVFDGDGAAVTAGAEGTAPVTLVHLSATGTAATRYDARPGTVVLLRPDQHVCARWRAPTAADVAAALRRALALH